MNAICALPFAIGIGLLLAIAVSDLRTRRIPNPLVGAFALVFFLRWATAPAGFDPLYHFALGFGTLVVTIALWSAGVFGGGDAKLLAACTLWLGPDALFSFLLLLVMATLGFIFLVLAFGLAGRTIADGPSKFAQGLARETFPFGPPVVAATIIVMVVNWSCPWP